MTFSQHVYATLLIALTLVLLFIPIACADVRRISAAGPEPEPEERAAPGYHRHGQLPGQVRASRLRAVADVPVQDRSDVDAAAINARAGVR